MASHKIGALSIDFSLETEDALKGLRNTQAQIKDLEKTIRPATQALNDMGKTFAIVGAAITGLLGVAVKQAADYGDSIRDAAIRTGIATEALGGLKLAAEQSGTGMEELSVALKKLAVNSDAAAKGSKAQVELFKAVGVSVRDATGAMRPMDAILGDVAEHFKASTNATKAAGEAVELFGRNGVQLVEFLKLGKTGLADFQKEAERLGLTISGNTADAADAFKDTLNELHNAETGLAISIGNALLPILTRFAQTLTDGIVAIKDFTNHNQDLVKVIAGVGVALTGAGGLLLGLAGLLTILPKVASAWGVLDVAMTANPIGAAAVAIVGLTAALIYFKTEVLSYVNNTGALLVGLWGETISAAGTLALAVGQTGLGLQMKVAGESIKLTAGHMIEMSADLLNGANSADKTADALRGLGKAGKSGADGIIENTEAMKEAAKIAAKYREALADIYRDQVERAAKFVKSWVEGFDKTSEAADKFTDALQRQQVAASKLGPTTIDFIIEMGKTWDKVNGQIFEDQTELYNKIHGLQKTDLDEKVEFDEAWDKALKKSNEKRAADYKKSIDDIRKSAGHVFDDMFIKGESVFKSLQNLLKGGALSLGRTIFEDITGALLGPVLNAFRNFFNTTLKGIIDGALGGIGKSIGGALAGVIGIGGGGAIKSVGNTTIGTAGAGLGGTAGLLGLSGAATLGVGAAIAGAALIAAKYIGQGRKAADLFTGGSQGQFDKDLGSVFGQFQSSQAAGTLTLSSAKELRASLQNILDSVTDSANQYATQGKNQKKVVDQFFAQQQELFGPKWSALTSQIDASIASLTGSPAGTTASTATLAGIPDTGRAVSASSIFANAVDVFKSAVDRVSGSGGAVGGGPVTVTVSSAPVFNIQVSSDDVAFQVRNVILPEALRDLQGDVNAVATKLIQIIKPRWDSTPSLGGAVA